METVRNRHDEQQQKKDLRIPKVVFKETRHDKTAERRNRRQDGPACVFRRGFQHAHEISVNSKNEPDKRGQAQQSSFCSDLNDVVVQMAVVKVVEIGSAVIMRKLGVNSFRPYTEQGMILNHPESGKKHLQASCIRRELFTEAHGYTMVRSEEHTSELQSPCNLVCRLLLEKTRSDS